MIYIPHPSELVLFSDQGSGNMGDVDDVDSEARFSLEAEKCYTLYAIWGTFSDLSGSSTGTADCLVRKDSRLTVPEATAYTAGSSDGTLASRYDHTLVTLDNVGIDATAGHKPIMLRVQPDEYGAFTFWRNRDTGLLDICVLTWANPDSGNMAWGLEVALWDTSNA